MCGIVGFLKLNNFIYNFNPEKLIKQMNQQVKSRGPDFNDIWNDDNKNIFFGHSRLSIIDLSKSGNQPMHSRSKRWTIVFNGEIYNFKHLKNFFDDKSDLTGDTSVLVNLIEKIGFRKTLNEIDGMFSFAVWDNLEKKLFLARDRLGEKPLYYSINENFLIFGSNLNSVKIFPNQSLKISNEALNSYLKLNYIPSPLSIYENIFKLEPGNLLEYDFKNKTQLVEKYWIIKKNQEYLNIDLISETEKIISETVNNQLESDVELGTLLSGGIDSTLITLLVKKKKNTRFKTFTLNSGHYNFDESKRAKEIADYIGVDNLNYKVTESELLETIESLPKIYGEPFGDSSQIPTILISKYAKNFVKVVLSGDGGDECFGGYNRYKFLNNYFQKISYLPNFMRKKIGKYLYKLNPTKIDYFFKIINRTLPDSKKIYNYGYLLNKLGKVLNEDKLEKIFYLLINNDVSLEKILLSKNLYKKTIKDEKIININDVINHDLNNYLPDDVLCKVDRASMAYGLEVRAPFVNHKVVEFSQNIPINKKIYNGEKKFLLKSILKKYLPKKLYTGQKRGFSVPISDWLSNELKAALFDYSNQSLLKNQGIFDHAKINEIITNHQSQKVTNEKFLWSFLIFQKWYFENK